jgi:predicted AlkP superfamily pyrophosphatase or phosphodiesterase
MRLACVGFLVAAALAAQPRHVVVISLDGYPAYALRDPQTPAPTLRRLIREGAWASDGMTPVNPTVTWPNHTSMLTGVEPARHGVIYNGLPVRGEGRVRIDAKAPKQELVLTPTVYDLAHARGMKTAEIDWPATQDASAIDFAFSEVPSAGSVVVKEMVAAGALSAGDVETFAKAPITYRDEIWVEAAIHILKTHQPNLLLVHLLTTDSAQHTYGPRSLGAAATLALADRHVERIVEAVRAAGLLDRTTFLIVSDHGFHSAKRLIRPAALLKEKGLSGPIVVSEGGTAMLYGATSPDVFRGVEGIQQVITPDQFAALGYPALGFPAKPGRMADLVLVAADGYAFSSDANSPVVSDVPAGTSPGVHGYLASMADMRPIFIAWGAGIKAGARVERVRTIDLAPTMARLLGFEMRDVTGTVIAGALK